MGVEMEMCGNPRATRIAVTLTLTRIIITLIARTTTTCRLRVCERRNGVRNKAVRNARRAFRIFHCKFWLFLSPFLSAILCFCNFGFNTTRRHRHRQRRPRRRISISRVTSRVRTHGTRYGEQQRRRELSEARGVLPKEPYAAICLTCGWSACGCVSAS